MNRTIAFTLLFVISAYILGCSKSDNTYPLLPTNAGPDTFVVETRAFEIGSERYSADFGTVAVPENRNTASSRLITIPFLRIHSRSKSPAEPIFGLAGGPGASNVSWDWGKASTFLDRRDFVVVGYRGVDGSSVLDCPDVTEAFKADDDVLSEESMKRIGRAWSACAEHLRAQGVDLDGYSMIQTIEDNESVRRALGYKRIHLLSESYGTRVAYLYALKYPDRIFRSAMISVNPPGHFVWEPRTVNAQLRQYAALWSKDPTLSSKSPDLYATMENVLTAMPQKWLFFSINPGAVKVTTFALLFHRKTAAMVFNAYTAAGEGDPSGLALMSLAYNYVVPSMMTWGDLASKAVSADFDSARNYSADLDPPDLPLGSPMGKLLWGPLRYCRWPMQQLPEEFRTLQRSDVETMLLSGNIDFSTPAEFAAKDLLPYLKNGKQIIFSECGHVSDIWYAGTENTRLILTSFYDTGVPNTSLNSYIPMDFTVSWGFPAIAKIALSAFAVAGAVLVACMVWLIRRFFRRKSTGISSNLEVRETIGPV